jgi:hypothetical protein
MRKRYKQNPDGTLEFVGVIKQAPYESNSFAAGDIPDMMRDRERRLADHHKKQKADRLQTIVNAVNKHGYT